MAPPFEDLGGYRSLMVRRRPFSPGSSRRGDPHLAPRKQNGHGRAPRGVVQRGRKSGSGGVASELVGGVVHAPRLMFSPTSHTGKQGDVLRGQRLHQQERDGVPDAPGQVRRRLQELKQEACRCADRLLCVCPEC